MNTFYSNYVRLCAKKGKSASGVAKEIGLSNAAANGWKNGKEPSDVTLQKLSVYFGVPVSELTEEKEIMYDTQLESYLEKLTPDE